MKHHSENIDLSDEEKILVGILRSLELRPKEPKTGETFISEELKVRPTQDGITAVSSRRLKAQNEDANCAALLEALVQKKLLVFDEGIYTLTDAGRIIGNDVLAKWSSEFYDDILVRNAESEAHAQFCERVFGKNLCQFNVMDMEQLEAMLETLNLKPNDYLLDLGCGLGKIGEYIATRTGARVLEIDFAEKVIRWAQTHTQSRDGRLAFQVGDMNELALPPSTFDAIIAVDTLYSWFVADQGATIGKLKTLLKPTGQMGIFYDQYQGTEPPDTLKPENTEIGKALTRNGLRFKTIDFTENSHNFWRRTLVVAQELQDMFEKEGNLDLCEERIRDSKEKIDHHDNDQRRRYFYHVS
ncbi:MAG: methyltransferase domain-containing protein [Candidatus Heimdallarchaeota archaeon]